MSQLTELLNGYSMMHFAKNLIFCLGLALLVTAVGCDSGPEMGQVTGTVTVDDQPAANLEVSFNPKEAGVGTTALAYTDAEGAYELYYPGGKTGAPLGEYSVSIVTSEMEGEDDDGEAEYESQDERPADAIPACYNTKTILSHTVVSGPNTADFNLKSEGE